jgi:serine phosphatase RsbU (regulator of sigma subunit)
LRLEKGDVLYLTTDGYPDQFGGPAGKKYMTKNLKNFLAGISSMKADVQEQQVRTNIREWMQNYEQVDDLLVIGIRL